MWIETDENRAKLDIALSEGSYEMKVFSKSKLDICYFERIEKAGH